MVSSGYANRRTASSLYFPLEKNTRFERKNLGSVAKQKNSNAPVFLFCNAPNKHDLRRFGPHHSRGAFPLLPSLVTPLLQCNGIHRMHTYSHVVLMFLFAYSNLAFTLFANGIEFVSSLAMKHWAMNSCISSLKSSRYLSKSS